VIRRIVIEELCEHGNYRCSEVIEWPFNTATNGNDFIPRPCPGGSRTVLSEPSEEMVERAANHVWSDGFNDENGNFAEWKPRFIRAVLDAALFSSDVGEREETE
jgi:hypothetical protein